MTRTRVHLYGIEGLCYNTIVGNKMEEKRIHELILARDKVFCSASPHQCC